MATALLCYSLVGRPQGRRGATKAELLASVFQPTGGGLSPFPASDEVFNALTGEDGLGALEVTTPLSAPSRYFLSIKQTLRMYFTSALALVKPEERDEFVWEVAQRLAKQGPFDEKIPISAPANATIPLERIFEEVDSTQTRLLVLDPRRWTLLNGRDSAGRAEITAVLGVGPNALRVDNAASCVVACVNTQRRDVARKRAGEVLAWRYVVRQMSDDAEDELRDARAKRDEAEAKLARDIERAFQHYAYLVRAGDLQVEFKRFDEDTRTALRGDHVWTALMDAGRATHSGGLAARYLGALLDTFDRELTPKEIVQAFYKNPAFPLVPSTDEIRRALFDLLRDGWEVADADSNPLSVDSATQISINSINQVVRHQLAAPSSSGGVAVGGRPPLGGGGTLIGGGDEATATQQALPPPPTHSGSPNYKRYIVELTNRSITTPEAREEVWQLLREVSKIIDVTTPADHQLLSLNITLTTAEGDQGSLEHKAQQAGARVRVEDDEF